MEFIVLLRACTRKLLQPELCAARVNENALLVIWLAVCVSYGFHRCLGISILTTGLSPAQLYRPFFAKNEPNAHFKTKINIFAWTERCEWTEQIVGGFLSLFSPLSFRKYKRKTNQTVTNGRRRKNLTTNERVKKHTQKLFRFMGIGWDVLLFGGVEE